MTKASLGVTYMRYQVTGPLLLVAGISLVVVPLIGGALLKVMFRLLGRPEVTYKRCWLAYLAAYAGASVLCAAIILVRFSSGGVGAAVARMDLLLIVAIGVHLVVVPLVMRVGWGKAAAAQMLTIIVYTLALLPIAIPVANAVRNKAKRVLVANNLRMLAEGMHQYLSDHQQFPAEAIYGADGTPLLSWRVAILPYIGRRDLYERFKLDEPWDSPHNQALAAEIPQVFALPAGEQVPGVTHYQVFVQTWPTDRPSGDVRGRAPWGQRAPMARPAPLRPESITDGPANTVMIVEAKRSVPWTKPQDLPFGPGIALPELGAFGDDYFAVVFFDLHTALIPTRNADDETLRGAITADGAEAVNLEY